MHKSMAREQEPPVVAIVGRPNVGKSSLLNRLAQRRVALVEETPGVTRDRIYAPCTWRARSFLLVDTGGLSDQGQFWQAIAQQVDEAIAEAALVLFVVDARQPLTAEDEEVARRMRRLGKPVLLVANKAESRNLDTGDVYRLGLGEPYFVSAAHGHGTGDLLDAIVEKLELPVDGDAPATSGEGEPAPLRVAIVGRPNAGKSTLVNRALGRSRMTVSEVPGTTTDAVDVEVRVGGRPYLLIDTAGLRRPARVDAHLEGLAGLHARKAIGRADVAVLLLDPDDVLTEQDKRIVKLAGEAGIGLVIGVNKWDLRQHEAKEADQVLAGLRAALPAADYAPIVFLSGRTGLHVERLFAEISRVGEQIDLRMPTAQLNREIEEAMYQQPPPSVKGRQLKVLYATQVARRPPHVVLFVNDPALCHFSYQRFIENRLRQAFGLHLAPLRITLRRREGRPR